MQRVAREFHRWVAAAPVSLALLGNQVFPADNPWNQKIASAPVAANSNAVMNSIITTFGDGRLHPDFGQDSYNNNDLFGIPYNVVHGNSVTATSVVIDAYADQSDVLPVPLPANPVLEGDLQNGPVVGLNNRGDSHLLVYDEDNNVAYEFYNATRAIRRIRMGSTCAAGVGLEFEYGCVSDGGVDVGGCGGVADFAGAGAAG